MDKKYIIIAVIVLVAVVIGFELGKNKPQYVFYNGGEVQLCSK